MLLTCFMNVVGFVTLIVSVISLIYAILNVSYPQIECMDFSGHAELRFSYATIRLTNIGNILTISKIEDTYAYLNPNDIKILPLKWKTNEDIIFCLKDKTIPSDFEIRLILSDKKKNIFLCKVKKGTKNIDIEIKRKFFYYR